MTEQCLAEGPLAPWCPLGAGAGRQCALYRSLFLGSGVAQLLVDPDDRIALVANDAALGLFGCAGRDLTGCDLRELFGLTVNEWLTPQEPPDARGRQFFGELDVHGVTRSFELYTTELQAGGRSIQHWILHDITTRRENEQAAEEKTRELAYHLTELGDAKRRYEEQACSYAELMEELARARDEAEENEKRYRTLAENSPVGIWHLAADGSLLYMNSALRTLVSAAADLTDDACHAALSGCAAEAMADVRSIWDGGVGAGCEIDFADPAGDGVRHIAIYGAPVMGHDGAVGSVLATVTDITDQRKAEETIRQMAHHDALTGLANRNLFHERLTEAIANSARIDRLVALMFIDLDNFKEVNDTFGHPTGDALLQVVAKRLGTVVRQTDTLARLGGDEFGIVFTNLKSVDPVNILARRIVESFAEPVTADGSLVKTGVSIGVSLFPHDDKDPDQLIRKADLALYQAKAKGRNCFYLYDEMMHTKVTEQTVMENDLRVALVRDEFELYFQPQVSLIDEQVLGVEALVRWNHPSRGQVSPLHFIPIAEKSGLIGPLGQWILRSACVQGQAWRDAGLPPLLVAVNISVSQLKAGLYDEVVAVLDESGFDPNHLELELTEGMMIERADEVVGILERLAGLGVKIAVDDFGTGYSSLARLKRFPVNKLKIDRSFVQNLEDDPDFTAITEAVIRIGHSLNLSVIAEGVETSAQVAHLVDKGCDEAQGYLYSPPLPAGAFESWLRARISGEDVTGQS